MGGSLARKQRRAVARNIKKAREQELKHAGAVVRRSGIVLVKNGDVVREVDGGRSEVPTKARRSGPRSV